MYIQNIPSRLKAGYGGKSFKYEITESVTLTGAYWSGGSRNTYCWQNLETGATAPIDFNPAPQLLELIAA